MSPLKAVSASMLLMPPFCVVAAPAPSSNFKIEVELTNTSGARTSVPVQCLEGCDWEETIIDCPEGETVCRATIQARSGPDPSQDAPTEVRPISGTVCVGIAPWRPEAAVAQGLRTAESLEGKRSTVVGGVLEGSPADLAGFKKGDLIINFNGVPDQDLEEFMAAVQSMAPGQTFEATLDRNGALVQARGTLGILTTAHTCVDARLLQTLAVTLEELKPSPFKLVIDAPNWEINVNCLEWCAWGAGAKEFEWEDAPLSRRVIVNQRGLELVLPE